MRLLLKNRQAPGDVLMLTAAVRELHRNHPGRFVTTVRTSCPELWQNNPLIVPDDPFGKFDLTIDCAYSLVNDSDQRPYHFIHGFVQDLEVKLRLSIPIRSFKGDLHLSEKERTSPSLAGSDPYWVVIAGGKFDLTTKWWNPDSFQAVIDHFHKRIRFVQCGQANHFHPPLCGVTNLIGRTDLRELIQVIYHADGVICPVTFAMHVAAALPDRTGARHGRACVVIAGGREAPHWEMYPRHQFLHTVGALDCCARGGCWKSRCQPIGDGSDHDLRLCAHPVRVRDDLQIAQCMTLITPAKVIDAIELYRDQSAQQRQPQFSPATPLVIDEISVRTKGVAVTIGVGEFSELATLAARELGALTGLDTIVLTAEHLADSRLEHPALLKFRLADYVDAENVLYFDADMVCLERWNPADYFSDPGIVAVRDRMIGPLLAECDQWRISPEDYFNSGLIFLHPGRHRAWLRRAEALRHSQPTNFLEQSPLNAARQHLQIPLRLIDRRFNWLGFGASSLSQDAQVVMAHKLAPSRIDLNASYLRGTYALPRPVMPFDDLEFGRLCGRRFECRGLLNTPRFLTLRGDGTILPPQPPDRAGYWFVHVLRARPVLVLASETRVLHELNETLGGDWISSDGESRLWDLSTREEPITEANARSRADRFLENVPPYDASSFTGAGIVICGGGEKYLPGAWVTISHLRRLGCALPIELWHLRNGELPDTVRRALAGKNVRCVNAAQVRQQRPIRFLAGFELKPYSILHSNFEQILYLDADNLAVIDPAFLFDEAPYKAHGALFWPDYKRLDSGRSIWRICQVPYRDEAEFESGQMLIDKRRCWQALQLTMHLNEASHFYYQHVHGDKETFHMAWRMLDQPYAMIPHAIHTLDATMCQHDPRGRRLFQHRAHDKWTLRGRNRRVEGFQWEPECRDYLDELSEIWKCTTAQRSW